MHAPTIIVISAVFCFLTCADTGSRSSAKPEETPAEVVAKYVSFARAGEFDKVKALVVSSLEKAAKPVNASAAAETGASKAKEPGQLTVVSDPRPFADAQQKWIAEEFAESIRNEDLSIKSVRKESAKDGEAIVEVVLGNDKQINVLGWVFRLRKVDKAGWRIYGLTTPGALLEPSPEKAGAAPHR